MHTKPTRTDGLNFATTTTTACSSTMWRFFFVSPSVSLSLRFRRSTVSMLVKVEHARTGSVSVCMAHTHAYAPSASLMDVSHNYQSILELRSVGGSGGRDGHNRRSSGQGRTGVVGCVHACTQALRPRPLNNSRRRRRRCCQTGMAQRMEIVYAVLMCDLRRRLAVSVCWRGVVFTSSSASQMNTTTAAAAAAHALSTCVVDYNFC